MSPSVRRDLPGALLLAFLGVALPASAFAGAAWLPDGDPLVSAPGDQIIDFVGPYSSGGFFTLWTDDRNALTTGRDLFGSNFGSTIISEAPGTQKDAVAAESGIRTGPPIGIVEFGILVAYSDGSLEPPVLRLKRVAEDAVSVPWPDTGLVVTSSWVEGSARVAGRTNGGTQEIGGGFIAWIEDSTRRIDVQRYDNSATSMWPPEGLLMSRRSPGSLQSAMQMVGNGADDLIVAWLEVDIYSGNVLPNGRVSVERLTPVAVRLSAPTPNPFAKDVTLSLDLPAETRVSVRVDDVAGRIIRNVLDAEFTAGVHVLRRDGRSDAGTPVPPGLYFIRARTPQGWASRREVRVR